MPSVRSSVACGLVLSIAALSVAAPASAETIFLKNGTRVKGKIVKQDDQYFQVQTANGMVKLDKDGVAIGDLPNPDIALILGVGFPGAGNAYDNRWDKTIFYLAFTAIAFAAAFVPVQYAGNYAPGQMGLPILAGLGAAAIPWGVGAYDAYRDARLQDGQPKFRIEYSDGQ